MIASDAGYIFRFGGFVLDVESYLLTKAGERLRLEKLPMDLLIVLVENAGRLVDRATLYLALWGPDVFVERDAAIDTAIKRFARRSATMRRGRGSSRPSSGRATGSSLRWHSPRSRRRWAGTSRARHAPLRARTGKTWWAAPPKRPSSSITHRCRAAMPESW